MIDPHTIVTDQELLRKKALRKVGQSRSGKPNKWPQTVFIIHGPKIMSELSR